MWCSRFLFTLLFLASPAFAGVQEVWWNITYVLNANPDGLYERRVIGVNGTWPPPPISINSTDSLLLHATNSLDVATTLHHHGMYMNSTSWMDGALAVGQCGIPPGQTFHYSIPVNTSDQWGTYWVHAHASGQYVDGLRAPFVIHPPQEAYSYDEEFTVVLGDWYHQEHTVLMQQYVNIADPGGAEPIPDSGLMYFAQNATNLPPIPGSNPSPVTAATGFNENATLNFVPGRTYRLRIISEAAFAGFYFWIDGHEMRLIEADGTDIQSKTVDQINLGAAQRYSILVTARNDTSPSNWAIHANMDYTMFDTVPATLNPNVTSYITYSSGAPKTDLGNVSTYDVINDMDLVPLTVIEQLPSGSTIPLLVSFDTMDDGTNRAMFNGVTYVPPLVPATLSVLTLGQNASVQEAYGPLSFVVNHLDFIDIQVNNSDTNKHPFHLHGHKYQIINRSLQYNSTDPTVNPPLAEGQANPMRRDTTIVPAGGSLTFRIAADNPGVWFFHCHIDWHLQVGLAMQLVEAPLIAQERSVGNVPSFVYDQCAMTNTPSSGNAAGHASTTDLSGWTLGPYQQVLGWLPRAIGAMAGCVLTAVLGMITVTWYSFGGSITDEEMEEEVRIKIAEKEKKRGIFGRFRRKKD
ncbi:Fet3 ferroxidase [Serpula lacrymans var. lacrymans S7.3]|uniref:Fet3 ferroxidase n=2 Tax=Serpula lacrymans var. lacrymans TaxID=341189 RepID=F8PJQ7_SERL3|nr:Fet3 ferroxidase [Serpula lacrymans var. lacrymans S7.9]EGO03467.1 Fet3 ferroxidase [Serpula lacrymans var. lacrymans S7.3]EGO29227.1 Fet3 ferroxidase [Serpula lacrymans var. lacrymans S7.9]